MNRRKQISIFLKGPLRRSEGCKIALCPVTWSIFTFLVGGVYSDDQSPAGLQAVQLKPRPLQLAHVPQQNLIFSVPQFWQETVDSKISKMHFSKSVNIGKGLHLTEVEGLVQAAAPARAADHRQRGVRLPGDAALLGGTRQSCDRRHSGVRKLEATIHVLLKDT